MSDGKEEFDPRIHLFGDVDNDRKPSARDKGGGREEESSGAARSAGVDAYERADAYLSDTVVTTAAAPAPVEFDEDPDEALARRLQEEMEEQERMISHRAPTNSEEEDAALARRLMQQGSFRSLDISSLPEDGVGHSRGMGQDNDSSLELARRLQREQQNEPLGSADEALARQLFEESLINITGGEDLRTFAAGASIGPPGRRHNSELSAIPGESDEELARRYFKQSMRALAGTTVDSGVPEDAAESDEALARRLQAQQFREGRPSNTAPDRPRSRNPNSASMQDRDEALARRLMQEGLDELRSGQMDAARRTTHNDEDMELASRMQNLETLRGDNSGSSDYERMARLRQEQEDELIARRFAQDTGDRTRPGARQVNTPATIAPRPAGTGNRANVAPIPPPPPPPAPPRSSPPRVDASAGGSSNGHQLQTSIPVQQCPVHSSMPSPAVVDEAPAELLPGADRNKKKRGSSLFNKLKNRGKPGGDTSKPGAPLPIPPPPAPPQRATSRPGPFPHSVSISQILPIASQPQQGRGPGNMDIPQAAARAPVSSTNGGGRKTGNAPMCCVCKKPAPSYLSTLDKKYHPECFKCMGCHESIDHSSPFAYTVGEGGEKHPLHRKCYAELFGIKCAVCRRSIPTGSDGKVSYVKHPFFDKERMCPRHAQNPGRRCTGCHRFEPEGDGFADLGDAGRCVCMSCCRSVVVDSTDAKPLWKMVVSFFEDVLGLSLWGDMRNTPVLVVGYDALNDQLQSAGGAHSGSSQIMTRGLCLSEHQSGRRIPIQRMHYDMGSRRFLADDVEDKGYTFFQVPDPSKINPNSSVTAILCLSGLPRDLTASILAHEATHAWFKLHPNFDVRRPIPLQVEEGCCQLMAYLFLQYLDSQKGAEGQSSSTTAAATARSKGSNSKTGEPTDEKLRQYFKFSIETDESEAYGLGYRAAAQVYAAIGIEALMSHVVMYRKFPDV